MEIYFGVILLILLIVFKYHNKVDIKNILNKFKQKTYKYIETEYYKKIFNKDNEEI